MLIAAAQSFVSSNIPANGEAIRQVMTMAATQDVRLICFGEGALSGYAKNHIRRPDDWAHFDWHQQKTELHKIGALCRKLGMSAVVGGAHPLSHGGPPHNSLYVFGTDGALMTRYDKRLLSNGELHGWYRPGYAPVVFELDGMRFGCATCIEAQFPEIFAEYEALATDAVIFASLAMPPFFEVAIQAHAGMTCQWIVAAITLEDPQSAPSGIVGPDGAWIGRGPNDGLAGYAIAKLDRSAPEYDVALSKARPWRARARKGDIYVRDSVDDPRSNNRTEF